MLEFDDYGNPLPGAIGKPAREDLPDLDALDAPELRNLVKRLFGAVYGVGLMNDEETAQAMLDRLAIDGLKSQDAKVTLANFTAWLDRKRGKPVQSVTLQSENGVAEDSAADIEREAKELLLLTQDVATKGNLVIDGMK